MPPDMNIEPEYQETLDYLYQFIDYSLVRNLRYSPEKFDLGRMLDFVAALGNPQSIYPVIHVAGTKGKGSVAALVASALQAAGYRVGLYTSPHLSDFAERMQVDGQPIPHRDLVDLVEELKAKIEAIPQLSTFEATTGLAFEYFRRRAVNAAVIEVGLGGRLDPTNVVSPAVCIITSISYDHTQILGETLAQIAAEKAGIIKPGAPVVVSPQVEEAGRVIEQTAVRQGAPLIQVGRDYLFSPLTRSLEGQTLQVSRAAGYSHSPSEVPPGAELPARLSIPLLGSHQVENAATAYAALQVARTRGIIASEEAIRAGFRSASWPGRFELLQRDPPVIIDSAHNRDSARRLRQAMDDYFPGLPIVLIFGASEDKDIDGMFAELLPRVRQVVATRSVHPRALEPERIVELARPYGCPVSVTGSVEEGLAEALRLAGTAAAVLVAGSIFVAAGVRETWFARLQPLGSKA
jgi:dihydrofolate synthase/folylpolyglutamate synthase